MKSLRRIQPTLILIVPRTLSYSNNHLPFCVLFPVQSVFSGKGGVGVGVRAEGESYKAGGIGGQVMGRKKHHLPCVTCGIGAGEPLQSRGCYGPTAAAVPQMQGCLRAPRCCVGRGLRLKPKSYFWSAVDRAVTAKQKAPDLPAGIPGESGLQAQQLSEAAVCRDTVSSKSPLPSPGSTLPGTISPSPTRRTRKPILFVDP